MIHLHLTFVVCSLVFGLVTAITAANDDGTESMSSPARWEDNRLDERIYADAPNYLTYQLSRKRYSVPYHPAARLRASQQAGVVLPYAMIDRNYVNDDGNRYEPVWKPTAAELVNLLMNRRKNTDPSGVDTTNFMRFGISKRTRFNEYY